MKITKVYIVLSLILVVGFLLRAYRISNVPPGLGNDEISIAYDAYSVINTGRDSTGAFLPLSFKSYNTYKAPLYAYVAGPFIKLIGNNEMAVRLPSVIFGTLTLLGIYFWVKRLGLGEIAALSSAFLLAITPWHIYTSRIALESNLALFFLVYGVVLFLKGLDKSKYLYLSTAFFALSLYAYHTEQIFTPLILISLICIYFKKINLKILITAGLLFLLLITPLILNVVFFKGGVRAGTEFFLNDFVLANKLAGVQNAVTYGYTIFTFWMDRYLQYLNFSYLFGHGLPIFAPYGSPDFGLLNILEFPLFLIGLYYLITKKVKLARNLVFSWLLIGPLVPSLTLGELNLVRNLVTVIPLTVISACGVVFIWEKFKTKWVLVICILALIFNAAFFYRYYLTYFPLYFSENWSYGFKEIALYAKEHEDSYRKIIIDFRYGTTTDIYGAPSLFVLYFNKIEPNKFLKEVRYGEESLGFGKYEFRKVDWPKEKITPGSLYVVGVRSNPVEGQTLKEVHSINLLNNSKAFKFYESY